MLKIDRFRDEYYWLSNFYKVDIIYENITYPSMEHFYVAMKTKDLKIRKHISNIKTPSEAKLYGKTMSIREDWGLVKKQIMMFGLKQKFNKEPFKQLLIDTKDMYIEEGNNWNDTYWGVCDGHGKNILGKMIMKIRKELK